MNSPLDPPFAGINSSWHTLLNRCNGGTATVATATVAGGTATVAGGVVIVFMRVSARLSAET